MSKYKTHDSIEFKQHLNLLFQKDNLHDIVFACIGTDRSTGDSFGPFIGTQLTKLGYKNVIGTLHEPLHAMNLVERLQNIPESKIVIGIDACLGSVSNIGEIRCGVGPVRPGAGVNKVLPSVGKFHITGTVNVGGYMEYFVLQNTRLNLVINMADIVVSGIANRFPLNTSLEVAVSDEH